MRNEPDASEVVPLPVGEMTTDIPDNGFWEFFSMIVPLSLACGVFCAFKTEMETKKTKVVTKILLNMGLSL